MINSPSPLRVMTEETVIENREEHQKRKAPVASYRHGDLGNEIRR